MKFVNVVRNSSGSVGIGTSDPPARLYVTGSYDATQTSVILRGGFSSPLGGAGILDVQNYSGNSILFVSGSGNVGVGTNNPLTRLDVVGSSANTIFALRSTDSTYSRMYLINTNRNWSVTANGTTLGPTGAFVIADETAGSFRFIIDSAGNTSIGSMNPAARLHVTGSSTATTPTAIIKEGVATPLGGAGILDVQKSDGTTVLFVSGSGFIGINTTTPFYQLDVVGQGRFSQALYAGSTGAITYNGGVTNTYNVIGLSGKSLSLGSNLVYDRIFLDTTGNVGIGTTLLDSKLVVNGNSVLSGSLNPAADNNSNYVIGTSTKRWSNIVSTSLSGSLTNLSDGTSYLIAGSGISIVTGSNGSVTINGQVGDITSVTAGNGLLGGGTSGDVTLTINDSIVATISGATFTGPVKFNSGLSGSLTQLTNGTSYLVAGNNVTITSASNGQVTINSSAPVGTISGTGTTNYVSKFTGTNTLGNSSIFDNGTSVGIGTTTPPAAALLTVSGTIVTKYDNGLESYVNTGNYNAGTTGFYPVYATFTRLGIYGSNDTVVKYGSGGNNFAVFHGTVPVITANSSDNVSVGPGSFTARLYVSGSGTSSTPTMVVQEGVANPTGGVGVLNVQNAAGTSLLFVSGSGRVGVGTNVLSTSNKFEVYQGRIAASGYSSELYVEGSNSGYSMLTAFGSGNYTDLWLRTVSATTDGVWIKATTGRVGIGSSSPGYPLDVNGTISSTSLRVGTSSGNALLNSFNGAVGAGFRVIDSTSPKLELWHDGNSVGQFNFSANTLVYGVHNGNGSVTEYFRVLSGGTLVVSGSAIPGTDATYDLGSTSKRWNNIYAANISGSITGSNLSAGQIVVAGTGGVLSGSNKLYWYNANSWVGIGTNSPASQVDLYGTSGGRVQLGFDSPAYGVTIQAAATPWARYYSFQNSSNTILGSFGGYGGSNSLTYLFIGAAYDNTALRADQSTGNVTVGNASGTGRLYVTGSSTPSTPTMVVREGTLPANSTGAFDVQNYLGTSLFYVSGSGNVGIGTTTMTSAFTRVVGVYGVGSAGISFNSNTNHYLVGANGPIFQIYDLTNSASRIEMSSAGNVAIGTTPSATDKLTVNGSMSTAGSILPTTDNLYNLGSTTKRWATIYATSVSGSLTGSNVTAGQVVVAGTGGVLSGSNNFWWDNTNGRVGIGTSNLSYDLVIGSNAGLTNRNIFIQDSGYGLLLSAGSGISKIQSRGTSMPLEFQAGNGNDGNYWFSSTGKVGIGTTTGIVARFTVTGSTTTTVPTMVLREAQSMATATALADFQNAAGSSLLFVSGSGNIGIGTNSPIGLLNLRGYTGGTAGSAVAAFNKSLVLGGAYNQTYNSGNAVLLHILDYSNDAGDNVYPIYVEDENNNVAFYVNGGADGGASIGTAYFGGSVGINSTSPTAKLNVVGSAFNASLPTMIVKEGVASPTGGVGVLNVQNSAGASLLFVSGSGNIGIGMTTPDAYQKLTVWGGNVHIQSTAASPGVGARLILSDSNFLSFVQTVMRGASSELSLGTDNTEKVRIDGSGNVGIGTSAMDSKLVVNGNAVISGTLNPDLDNSRDLGSTTKRWRNLYATSISGSLTGSNVSSGQVVVAGTGGVLSGTFGFVWNNSNNRVGIGSSTPQTSLDVGGFLHLGYDSNASNYSGISLHHNNIYPGSQYYSGLYHNNASGQLNLSDQSGAVNIYISNNSSYPFRIYSSAWGGSSYTITERLKVDGSNGNVTPGSDNAQDLGASNLRWANVYATNISGSLTGSNVLANQVVVAGTGGVLSGSYNLFWDNNNQKLGVGTSSVAASAIMQVNRQTGNLPQIALTNSGVAGTVHWIGTGWLNDGITGVTSDTLSIGNNLQKSVSIVSNNSSVLTVVDDGTKKKAVLPQANSYIGIGTTNPASILHVVGHTSAGTPTALIKEGIAAQSTGIAILDVQNSAGTSLLFVSGSGNVGIGTNNPQEKAHVYGNLKVGVLANGSFISLADEGTTGRYVGVYRAAGDTALGLGGWSGIVFAVSSNNLGSQTERMRIDSSGNVGIGTSVMADKLSVNGTMSVTGSYLNPGVDNSTKLGDTNKRWSNIYGTNILGNFLPTSMTPGSVLYINSSGAIAQDNSNLFWNDSTKRLGIGTATPGFKLEVNGDFAATTKSFVIPHPLKPGWKLRYGSLEGPENGVYVRGQSDSETIQLPDYWVPLVDEESITVQVTPIGKWQSLYVEKVENNQVKVGRGWFMRLFRIKPKYFYAVSAARKDSTFEVEYTPIGS